MFAGPTLERARMRGADAADLTIHPPVRRGDIAQLTRRAPAAGVICVVDGHFDLASFAVGHAELRDAIRAGWQVWGVSSMGAIRACELRTLGMLGWGQVYEAYCADPDLRDDEVALLHDPEPPYRESSEPLFHVRLGLRDLVARGVLADQARETIETELDRMWFGYRTLPLIHRRVCEACIGLDVDLDDWLRGFDRYRVKVSDLVSYLERRPWTEPVDPSAVG